MQFWLWDNEPESNIITYQIDNNNNNNDNDNVNVNDNNNSRKSVTWSAVPHVRY